MLRRTLAFATLVTTLLLLLAFAIGNPTKSLFASTLQQADSSDEGTALSQPMTVTVRQQIPFTITLVGSEVITQGATPTETVTQPITQTTVITFELETEVVVSSTGVITTPLSIKLASTQQPTTPFPVRSSLVVARNLLAQLGVEMLTLPELTEELTATESLTETEALTVSEALTATTEPTTTEEVTSTTEVTETVAPTTTEAVSESTVITFNATLTAISNIRSETNLDATSIVTQLAAGTPISAVAQSADQNFLLLDSGYWVSVLVVDAVPTGLPAATDELIAALRAASAPPAETPAPAPEATTVATPTVEATVETTTTTTSGPTVTVDANLRLGPGTEFEVLGGTVTGQAITIVGRNADGSWYRLDNGGWVASRLVANAPANETIPVVNNDGTPVTAPTEEPTPTEEPLLLPTATPTP